MRLSDDHYSLRVAFPWVLLDEQLLIKGSLPATLTAYKMLEKINVTSATLIPLEIIVQPSHFGGRSKTSPIDLIGPKAG